MSSFPLPLAPPLAYPRLLLRSSLLSPLSRLCCRVRRVTTRRSPLAALTLASLCPLFPSPPAPPFPSLSSVLSCSAGYNPPLPSRCPPARLSLPSRSPLSALFFPLPLPSFSLSPCPPFPSLSSVLSRSAGYNPPLPSRCPPARLSLPFFSLSPCPSFPLSLVCAVVFGGLQPAARLSLPSSPERFVLFPEQFPFLSFFLIFPCDNFHPYLSPSF